MANATSAVAAAVTTASPPAVVFGVLAVGLLQSAWLIINKPFSKTSDGAWSTLSSSVSDSTIGRPVVLACFRLLSCLQCIAVAVNQLQRRGPVVLSYYTVWSYWLLALYFGLAAAVSLRAMARRHAGVLDPGRRVNALEYAVISIFHVTLTTVWIVDSVAWLVLWPMLRRGSPAEVALVRPLIFCWTSYHQHGVNALQMLVELALNQLPISFYMMGFVGLWSCAYGVWAVLLYQHSGRWIYPFLDYTKPWAPVAYIGLFGVHWLFFGVVMGLKAFKARHLPVNQSAAEEGARKKVQ